MTITERVIQLIECSNIRINTKYCRVVNILTSTYNKHIKEKVQERKHGLVLARVALQ